MIIGLGAAAASFARYINSSTSVLIIESRAIPRDKPCSGILASLAHDYLRENGVPEYVFEEPRLLDVEYLDWDNNTSKFAKKSYYNTDRKKLDLWLSESALKKRNIHVVDNASFIDFIKVDPTLIKVIIQKDNELSSIIGRYLIGCDGALSTVRRKIIKTDIPYYLATKQMAKNNGLINSPKFIFDKEISDYYSWIIPKGDYIEVGAGVNLESPREKFNLFVSKVEKKYNLEVFGEIQSAVVLRPRNEKDIFLGKNNIFICGEAAGLITPSGAEGISFALLSGKYAAEALNEKFVDALSLYERKCEFLKNRLRPKFEKAKVISDPQLRKKLFE
ncbi:MAG: hypothetical protein WCI04_07190 [archaeon]